MKRLYFDLETSYNVVASWRVGYNLNLGPNMIIKERAIICVSYKWSDGRVKNIQWDNGCDAALLREFMEVCNEADEIVAHNGDKFDIKWLRTRCLKHGIPVFPKYVSIDTLKDARKFFNFNSNKLDYIASYLGLGHKGDPGGFDTWKAICENNCPTAMRRMVKYCNKDVTLLQQVHERLLPYTLHKTHYGAKRIDCPECGSRNTKRNKKTVSSAKVPKIQMNCRDCAKWWTIPESVFEKEATLDQYGAA